MSRYKKRFKSAVKSANGVNLKKVGAIALNYAIFRYHCDFLAFKSTTRGYKIRAYY